MRDRPANLGPTTTRKWSSVPYEYRIGIFGIWYSYSYWSLAPVQYEYSYDVSMQDIHRVASLFDMFLSTSITRPAALTLHDTHNAGRSIENLNLLVRSLLLNRICRQARVRGRGSQ